MVIDSRAMRIVHQAAQAAVVSSLCVLMVAPPALLAEDPAGAATTAARKAPLTQDQRVLHALNRLTFGPRPGDEAAVSKMGLEVWFQKQLHPETIDDSALDARLDMFPAMKLSQQELITRFPSPQMVRAMSQRGAALPSDPVLHAVYADALASYDYAQKRQAAGLPPVGAPAAAAGDNMMAGDQDMKAAVAANAELEKAAAQPDMAGGDAAMSGNAASAVVTAKGKNGKAAKYSNVGPAMSEADVEAVLALPPDARMKRLLAMSGQEMITFREALKPYERPRLLVGLSPAQIEIVTATQGPTRVVAAEAMDERLIRDVYSDRQLQAVMTDFWLNHFSVYVKKNQNEPYYLNAYERETIMPYALGKFENLLDATAQSPAMLMYLDNWESVGPDSPFVTKTVAQVAKFNPNGQAAQRLPKGINENYARELMELHTLGVNGGYTQKDVQEVAKVFTGWTIDRPYQGGLGGGSIFDATKHAGGDKMVLGHVIKENGQQEGREVLHILATSPATAHFVSKKLAIRFVSDNPPQALVDRMADAFLKSDGDIKAVLTTMFHSPEFWAPENYRAKVKTPIEFVASALRASEANVKNPQPLVQAMDKLGMPIYGMQTPNGYSWTKDDWVSSNALISRMNFALVLSGDHLPGTTTNWPTLLGDASGGVQGSPSASTEKHLEALLLGEPANEHTRATVMEQASNPTAQKMAQESFSKAPVKSDDGGDMQMADGGAPPARARGGRKDVGFQADAPETPLDTMAGLLLGSPDFQKR